MKNGPYELVIAPAGYPGRLYRGRYAYEHTVVWWQNTGKIPPKGFLIHHKNKQKRDNRFSNFELMKATSHNSLHAKPPAIVSLVCAYCGGGFVREKRNIETKRKQGQIDFCCSKSHQVKLQWLNGNHDNLKGSKS